MATSRLVGALSVAFVLGGTSALAAEDDGAVQSDDATGVSMYAVAGVGTTAAYVPNSGPAVGPLGDISPTVGVGVYLSPKVALEFDYAMTFTTADGYTTLGFGPALIWAFHPNVYAAGRLFVPVDPEVNLAVMPGIGFTQVFDSGFAPFLGLDLATLVGRGEPDLAVLPSAGASYTF